MVRFANIVIGYFIIGAVMWGGGALVWSDAGVGTLFINNPQTGDINENTTEQLKETGGPIQQAANAATGGLIAVWNLMVQLIGFLFWPIQTLADSNAPPQIVVLFGGTPTVAFVGAVIRVVRGSA